MHLTESVRPIPQPSFTMSTLPSLSNTKYSNNNVLPSINHLKSVSLPPISDILHKSPSSVQQHHLLPSVDYLHQHQPTQYMQRSNPNYHHHHYNHYTPMNSHQLHQRISPAPPPQMLHQQPPHAHMLRNNSYPPSSSTSPKSDTVAATHTHSNSHIANSNSRKTRNNLPKEITYILLRWLHDHINHPYPNSFEKNQLMMATGLNQQQLSNWFINARRRKIKGIKEQKRLNLI